MELVRRHRVDPNIIYDHRLPAKIFSRHIFLIQLRFCFVLVSRLIIVSQSRDFHEQRRRFRKPHLDT